MKRKKIYLLLTAIVLIGGTGIALSRGNVSLISGESASENGENPPGEKGTSTVQAEPGTITVQVDGPAVVEPYVSREIRSKISGTILHAAEEGEHLAQGEVLVRFDDADLKKDIQKAELDLEQARLDFRRSELVLHSAEEQVAEQEGLFSAGSITRAQLEKAREAAAHAELDRRAAGIKVDQNLLLLERANEKIDGTVIRASFRGVVLNSQAFEGEQVNSGAPLLTFADLTRLRVLAEVDEFDIAKIEAGMPVRISADMLGAESIDSRVDKVSPSAEIVNNISIFTVSALIHSKGNGERLRPGMSADLSVLVSNDTGLIVPASAVSSVRGR
ncbi:MAG: efflux RND transporter periplasmic adaptor subunit [Spirochaetia bacterium]|nr:efflux RND transporter periplasmic adaptor subunit [Spirochaetia bacterium]